LPGLAAGCLLAGREAGCDSLRAGRFLVAVAAAGLVVGVHDAALAGATLGVSVSGALLIVVGVVLLVAAYELVRLSDRRSWQEGERPPCKPVVLVAFLTIFVGAYAFLSAIRSTSTQRWFVTFAALVLMVVAVFGLRFFGSDARVTLPRLATIALGLVGTTVGAWQFWYSNQYAPSHAGRAVALDVELERAGKQSHDDVVRAVISFQGIGRTGVSVLGSTYTLTGSRIVRCRRPAAAAAVEKVFSGFLTDPQRTRFMSDVREIQPATVLAAGKFVGDGKRLDPDVPAGRDFVFLVPRGRYQLLRLRAQLFAIPASVRISQRTLPEFVTFDGDRNLYGFWHIDDDSWLRDLLYGRERWVVIRYELVGRPRATATSPDLRVTARFPDATWRKGRPGKDAAQELFEAREPSDASEPFADTELAQEDLAQPDTSEAKAHGCLKAG
jgi:hypothetical protein